MSPTSISTVVFALALSCMPLGMALTGTNSATIEVGGTIKRNSNAADAKACDESKWPDKDHGLVCGDCKVLVNHFASKYKTCDGYCKTVGLDCANAWEEENDTCKVKHTMTCDKALKSSDAICECAPMKAKTAADDKATAAADAADDGLSTTPSGSLDTIVFGGDETKTAHYLGKPNLVRPGSTKAMVCDGSDCVGCTDYDKCWHGGGGFDRLPGPLVLKKNNARKATSSYVVEVYAVCPTGGEWSLYVHVLKRGKLVIYSDFKKSGHMEIWKEVSEADFETKKLMLPSSVKEARVRVAFIPTDDSKKSEAYIMIKSKGVDPHVDRCMTVKECLGLLADSVEGFKLRNDNKLQLDCLEGKLKSDMCRKWDMCVSKDKANKEGLVVFLRAGVGKGSSLNQAAAAANDTAATTDPNMCVDPASDDAESWDCECLHDMQSDCEGSDDSLEECLRAKMCNFDAVCSHWKKDNNCPRHDQKMLVRRQVSTKSGHRAKAHTALLLADISERAEQKKTPASLAQGQLDTSVRGKCTTSTRS